MSMLKPQSPGFLVFEEVKRLNMVDFLSRHRVGIRQFIYDLTVESSVFVSKEWEGPIIPGYRGFLEKTGFALDPGVVPGEQVFYFGLVEILIFSKNGLTFFLKVW
jgi:hypothetical protein